MKKTGFVWVIVVAFILSLLSELFALINLPSVGFSSYYGSHSILNAIALVSLILDIAISGIFVYKLITLKKDVVLWTDITFGYSIARSLFAIFADVTSNKGTAFGNGIEIVIVLIVWVFFHKHLQKISKPGTEDDSATNDIKVGWVFGGISFIPLIGVLFGIIAIILGATRKVKGQIFLGIGGILFTVLIYGSLFYFGFVAKNGPFAEIKNQLTAQIISEDAGQISLYKNRTGQFPASINVLLPTSTLASNFFSPVDAWGNNLAYATSSKTFTLRSAGPDGVLNTDDDIVQTY